MGFDFPPAPGGVIPERGVSCTLSLFPCHQATSFGLCLRLGSFNVILSSFVSPEELLNNFAQQIGAWRFCLYFLSSTRNDYVMMYSLTVFEVRRALCLARLPVPVGWVGEGGWGAAALGSAGLEGLVLLWPRG